MTVVVEQPTLESSMCREIPYNRNSMRSSVAGSILLLVVTVAEAQAPADEARTRETAIQQKQQQAGAAFRRLEQVQHEARLAEQDFVSARDAHGAAQKQADERRQQLEAAKKALDAARSRVESARKVYEQALTGVDQVFHKPPAK